MASPSLATLRLNPPPVLLTHHEAHDDPGRLAGTAADSAAPVLTTIPPQALEIGCGNARLHSAGMRSCRIKARANRHQLRTMRLTYS